jgi:hypothetical protein
MIQPARPLADALRDAPESASLLARWEATQRAARCITPLCQSLAAGFDPMVAGLCELRDGVLLLTVPSASQCAKLKQAVPRLLTALGSDGNQVYGIRIRIKPGIMGYPEQGSSAEPNAELVWPRPSARAADAVSKLALTVGEGRLKEAAQKLARTLAKRANG